MPERVIKTALFKVGLTTPWRVYPSHPGLRLRAPLPKRNIRGSVSQSCFIVSEQLSEEESQKGFTCVKSLVITQTWRGSGSCSIKQVVNRHHCVFNLPRFSSVLHQKHTNSCRSLFVSLHKPFSWKDPQTETLPTQEKLVVTVGCWDVRFNDRTCPAERYEKSQVQKSYCNWGWRRYIGC